MKKFLFVIMLMGAITFLPQRQAHSQIFILEIIKAAIKKVIKAVDLQIQRQQNKVIWLQNAQKTLENELAKLKLDQITDWTKKQKELYQKYFDELKKVKALIAYYQRIKDIIQKQEKLVQSYNHAWQLLRNDTHFSVKEISYMGTVYNGILEQTGKNIDEMMTVINSFQTQMTDAKRIELISAIGDRVDQNYTDLQIFNRQNQALSIQRSTTKNEIETVKKMYGIKD